MKQNPKKRRPTLEVLTNFILDGQSVACTLLCFSTYRYASRLAETYPSVL